MSTSSRLSWCLGAYSVIACAALISSADTASAQAPLTAPGANPASEVRDTESLFHVVSPDSRVSIINQQVRVLEFAEKIVEVDGHNPDVITVEPVSYNQIRVRAESPGVTSMTIRDHTGASYKVEVFVEGDVRELQAYLRRLFPGTNIEAVALRDTVVLRGWVTEPDLIPQIMAITRQMYPTGVHNQMRVGGVNMVQLHVKIIEVQRSKLKQMGFNFLASGQRYAVSNAVGGLAPLSELSVPFAGAPDPVVTPSALARIPMQFAITGNSDRFQGFLDALVTEALAKTLAEPTLVTASGRPANLLSGGEFPILVPSGIGNVSIQFREFGVRMEAIPFVLGNGRLRLDIAPEVSERDFSSAVNVNGFVVPGINTRRVNTQVEMNFGETLMIGGLISRRRTATANKIPVLGELPLIGAAFSRKQHDMGETELLIMVTPEMAGPMRPDQVPQDVPGWLQDEPTMNELFSGGLLEVPAYGSDCETCPPGTGYPIGGQPGYAGGGVGANCAPQATQDSGPVTDSTTASPPETE
ncbi:MAG: hypothetical protein DWH91_16095 [Planctomycetota bacterium]|nr:MAG: hypothetical protein DWH91_16095 [Planctomycetota bacterium]